MKIFQELSGVSLFSLILSELNIEDSQIWSKLDAVILQDAVRFDADKSLHFDTQRSALHSCEMFLPMLQSVRSKHGMKILIEVKVCLVIDDWENFFENIFKFIIKNKLDGLKLKFIETSVLTKSLLKNMEKYFDFVIVLEMPDKFLDQDCGMLKHLIGCVDFVLLKAQGYFTTKFLNEVYGTKFHGLIANDDRSIDCVRGGLNNLFSKVGNLNSQVLLNIATSGVKFHEGTVTEIYREDFYCNQEFPGTQCYFDDHLHLMLKLWEFILKHKLAGVYLQDFKYDLPWVSKRSVLGCCFNFVREQSIESSLHYTLFETNEISRAPLDVRVLSSRTNTTESRGL